MHSIALFVAAGSKDDEEEEVEWSVSAPFNLQHGIHVDFNSSTGFSGLPSEWETMLKTSGIDKVCPPACSICSIQ